MQSAGENGGGANMAFMGMGMNAAGGMMGGMQQQTTPSSYQPAFGQHQSVSAQQTPQDPTTKLLEMKKLLDAGAITQEDYDKIKNQLLGL